jgi:hypothetical protein
VSLAEGKKKKKKKKSTVIPRRFCHPFLILDIVRQEEEGCSVLSSASSRLQDLQEWRLPRRRRTRIQERVSHPLDPKQACFTETQNLSQHYIPYLIRREKRARTTHQRRPLNNLHLRPPRRRSPPSSPTVCPAEYQARDDDD